MDAVSKNWKPEMLSSGESIKDSIYTNSQDGITTDDTNMHIGEKSTKRMSKLVDTVVFSGLALILIYLGYRVITAI